MTLPRIERASCLNLFICIVIIRWCRRVPSDIGSCFNFLAANWVRGWARSVELRLWSHSVTQRYRPSWIASGSGTRVRVRVRVREFVGHRDSVAKKNWVAKVGPDPESNGHPACNPPEHLYIAQVRTIRHRVWLALLHSGTSASDLDLGVQM
jgi:hypothetical protein